MMQKQRTSLLFALLVTAVTFSVCFASLPVVYAAEGDVEEIVGTMPVEDAEEITDGETDSFGETLKTVLLVGAGVGVLAAAYGIFMMVNSKQKINGELERVRKEKAEAAAEKAAETESEEETTVYLDEDGNLIQEPEYEEFK